MDQDDDVISAFRLQESPAHLLRLAIQRSTELFAEQAGAGDLTLRQFMVLLAVHQRPGCSQTELVDATGIDRSTMGEMLDRLVKRGFLQRRRSSQDHRANLIELMDPGLESLMAAIPAAQRAQERLLDVLEPELRNGFLDMLRRVAGVPDAGPAERRQATDTRATS